MIPSAKKMVALLAYLLTMVATLPAQGKRLDVKLPLRQGSVRFAVIGDSGTGDKEQYEVAKQMEAYRGRVKYDFVIMLGDNIYGGHSPQDFSRKFQGTANAFTRSSVATRSSMHSTAITWMRNS